MHWPNDTLCCLAAGGAMRSRKPNWRPGQQQHHCTTLLRMSPFVPLCADTVNPSPQASTARSTLRRFALLADRAAGFEFLDMIGSERDLAIADQVHFNLADAVGRLDRELVERFDIAADRDDEAVHHVLDAIGLLVDRVRDALKERLDLGKVEVRVRRDGDEAAVGPP